MKIKDEKIFRNLRRYDVTLDFFALFFETGSSFLVESGLPEGSKVTASFLNEEKGLLVLHVEHGSFDPIEEGDLVPCGDDVTFERLK